MKYFAVLGVLFIALSPTQAQQLCGPDTLLLSKTVRNKAAIELAPPADKALIYVFVQGGFNSISQQRRVSIDRQWVGVLRSGNYFVTVAEPGTRKLCGAMRGNSPAYADVELERGRTYYFEYHTYLASLQRVANEDAVVMLQRIQTRRIFWEKGQPEPK